MASRSVPTKATDQAKAAPGRNVARRVAPHVPRPPWASARAPAFPLARDPGAEAAPAAAREAPEAEAPVQLKPAAAGGDVTAPLPEPPPPPNRTGLPDRLKAGVEALSGLSMDDVRVHRNSTEPAKLGALAYAQGARIHLAPGQEQHLPHEAWHVIQQKQERVRATVQMNGGVAVNDEAKLEREADVMGAEALQPTARTHGAPRWTPSQPPVLQGFFEGSTAVDLSNAYQYLYANNPELVGQFSAVDRDDLSKANLDDWLQVNLGLGMAALNASIAAQRHPRMQAGAAAMPAVVAAAPAIAPAAPAVAPAAPAVAPPVAAAPIVYDMALLQAVIGGSFRPTVGGAQQSSDDENLTGKIKSHISISVADPSNVHVSFYPAADTTYANKIMKIGYTWNPARKEFRASGVVKEKWKPFLADYETMTQAAQTQIDALQHGLRARLP